MCRTIRHNDPEAKASQDIDVNPAHLNRSNRFSRVKMRVGIIGAGVSGLATAKVFLSAGHAVTVFEQRDTLGGVWAPARRYPGVRLQTTRHTYCFSDFAMPSHYPEFPTGQQLHEYLGAYAKH